MFDQALLYFKKIDMKISEKIEIPMDFILNDIFMCYYYLKDKKEASKILRTVESLFPYANDLETMQMLISLLPKWNKSLENAIRELW